MSSRSAYLLLASLLALSLGGPGCEPTDPAEERLKDFQAALPPSDVFEITIPGTEESADAGTATGGLETASLPLATAEAALLGERSAYQVATGAVRTGLKVYLKRIQSTLVAISDFVEPEFQDDTRAVWTRTTDSHLLVLTMRRAAEGYFTYQVLWRPRGDECAEWRVMLSGNYSPHGGNRLMGSGEVMMNFGLDADPDTVGKALVVWSREGADLRVTTSLYAARLGADGCRRAGVFDYQRQRSGGRAGGMLVWRTFVDAEGLDPEPCFDTPPPEDAGPRATAVVMSRWLESGAGRADVILPGPQLSDGGGWAFERRSECWDAGAHDATWEQLVRHGNDQGTLVLHEAGDVASCEFQEAGEPFLPPLGQVPPAMEPLTGFEDLDPRTGCE